MEVTVFPVLFINPIVELYWILNSFMPPAKTQLNCFYLLGFYWISLSHVSCLFESFFSFATWIPLQVPPGQCPGNSFTHLILIVISNRHLG